MQKLKGVTWWGSLLKVLSFSFAFFVPVTVSAWTWFDDFEPPNRWSFPPTGQCGDNPTDTTYQMEYSTAQSFSPITSLHQFITDGGTEGRDCVGLEAYRDFPVLSPGKVNLRVKYWISQFTDADDGFGGMNTWAEVRVRAFDRSGNALGKYRYIVACGLATVWPENPCQQTGNLKYVYNGATPNENGEFALVGRWLSLDEFPTDDLPIDWRKVRKLRISLILAGGFMYQDTAEIFWDDLHVIWRILEN